MAGTLRTNASKKRKDGVRNSTGSDEFAISNIKLFNENIRCSGCNRIPDKEIFSCLTGHLNCDICKLGNGICVREDCTQELTRSIVSEKLLNNITFKCPWTNLGCKEAIIRRKELTAHKKSCEYK